MMPFNDLIVTKYVIYCLYSAVKDKKPTYIIKEFPHFSFTISKFLLHFTTNKVLFYFKLGAFYVKSNRKGGDATFILITQCIKVISLSIRAKEKLKAAMNHGRFCLHR